MDITTAFKTFESNKSTVRCLIEQNVVSASKKCYHCKGAMKFYEESNMLYCLKKSCNRRVSIFKNTFFEGCKMSLSKLMKLGYMYIVSESSVTGIKRSLNISSKTLTEWLEFIRQLVGESVPEEEMTIGGEGVVVEVDETKLGRREYNRGHKVDGVWVVAGVERTTAKKMFVVSVEKRDEETITNIIKKHVLPGSIVYTDCWKPYIGACKNNDLDHQTVNHSKFYKDPETGTHTNTIEGNNNALKIVIKPRNRTKKNIKYHLLYFIWKRLNKKDLWQGFINALRGIKYI